MPNAEENIASTCSSLSAPAGIAILEEDCRTEAQLQAPRQDHGTSTRGGAVLNLEAGQAIEHAIGNGRGGIWLELSEDQYHKLKRACRPHPSAHSPLTS